MDFRDSREANTDMATDAIEALTTSTTPPSSDTSGAKRTLTARNDSKEVRAQLYPVEVDHSRDALLTEFGKDTLKDRYLLPGETFQDLFVRVASAYADDAGHAQRLYSYI
ncbi:ribonucleotide-diphosphate reductase subunit alpha, partial [Sphingomonas sp. HMWF008]